MIAVSAWLLARRITRRRRFNRTFNRTEDGMRSAVQNKQTYRHTDPPGAPLGRGVATIHSLLQTRSPARWSLPLLIRRWPLLSFWGGGGGGSSGQRVVG